LGLFSFTYKVFPDFKKVSYLVVIIELQVQALQLHIKDPETGKKWTC